MPPEGGQAESDMRHSRPCVILLALRQQGALRDPALRAGRQRHQNDQQSSDGRHDPDAEDEGRVSIGL